MAIETTANLAKAIYAIETKRLEQKENLVKQFTKTYVSLHPINLIKSGFNDITKSPVVKNNLLNLPVGVGAWMATKKLWIGKSNSLFKKIIGRVLEFGVTNLVTKKGGTIIEKVVQVLLSFLKRNKVHK